MKLTIVMFVIFFSQKNYGQYKIDKNIKTEYEKSIKTYSEEEIKTLNSFQDSLGKAIPINYRFDTLNKSELLPKEKVSDHQEESFVEDEFGNEIPIKQNKKPDDKNVLFCMSGINNDTLFIVISAFLAGAAIKIYGRKSKGNIYLFYPDDSVFKAAANSSKVNYLIVDASVEKLILTNLPKKVGDDFYGKLKLTTNSFYIKDKNFSTGFICLRFIGSFLFLGNIVSPSKKH